MTPPPLPRPPAWIWALTTQTGPPSERAAVDRLVDGERGNPARGRQAEAAEDFLALILVDLHGFSPFIPVAIPLRIILPDGIRRGRERVTVVELERLALAFVFALQARESLDRGRRERAEHFGQVRATLHAPHRFVQTLAKAVDQVRADERSIGRLDAIAGARIGHPVRSHFDRVHGKSAVDGHAHPHVVHGFARRSHPGQQLEVVVLGVDEVGLDVEQAVVPPKAFELEVPHVQARARDGTG